MTEPVPLENVRVVSRRETTRRAACADPRWVAAWQQLTTDGLPGETSYTVMSRRVAALRILHDVESQYEVRAGFRFGV